MTDDSFPPKPTTDGAHIAFGRRLNPAQAAKLIGCTPATLRQWRHRDYGPRFFKFRGVLWYLTDDVLAFIEAGMHSPSGA